ncbi:hypothetical protein [Longimicrobium sp.]|jgi:hypothetical protein|uniref:hypothetical protein n=1 Tax=Longimicrobium sp. TaxID=2029185 RepID=UPI002F92E17B
MSTHSVRSTATALILRTLPSPEPSTDTGKRLQGGQVATVHGLSLDGKWLFVAAPAGAGWASAGHLEDVPQPPVKVPAWRTAESLRTLLRQLNAAHPNRSKVHDGTIGDAAHADRKSDHNPNADRVVTALDVTHDPRNGPDCGRLALALVASRDPRIKYIIWEGRMCRSYRAKDGTAPWTWTPYTGPNKHTKHLHLSVAGEPGLYDDARLWRIK